MIPGYAELHCLTSYSFLRGASSPEELVHRADELGYRALAITDECSVAGIVRAHVAAKEVGLKLIIGSEFTLVDGMKLVLLATSLRGYEQLCELITLARRAAPKGEYRLGREDIPGNPEGLVALWLPSPRPSPKGEGESAPSPLVEGESAPSPLGEGRGEGQWIANHFPNNAWLAIELHRGADDEARIAELEALAREAGLPCVAAGDVHMHTRDRKRLQDMMSAIRLQCPLAHAGRRLHPNAERYLRTIGRISGIYPVRLLAASLDVASRCTFSLDEIRYEYP
jgi:error-prone DNA polymerase